MAESNEQIIRSHAAEVIKAGKMTDWSQEAHNALVARLCKRHCGMNDEQLKKLMGLQQEVPALTANASAFRKKLQSKDWGHMLPETDEAKPLGNRYSGLV